MASHGPSGERSAKSNREPSPWLQRADHAVIGALVALAVVAMLGYWWSQRQSTGPWTETSPAVFADANVDDQLRSVGYDPARERPFAERDGGFAIDLNTADWPELTVLPGIGEALARRIVASRETDGPFTDVDNLQRVHGIGPKTIERLRPWLKPIEENAATLAEYP